MNSEKVQAAFRQVFRDSSMYGNSTFIIGKDKINRTIKNNIIQHYLEYKNEFPLLAFTYVDEMNSGFVITNFRIVWRYSDGYTKGDVDLEDIQRIEIGRSLLARVMRIVDVTGKKYSEIYLTGMDEEDNFVSKLNEFIALLNGVDEEDTSHWPTYDEEKPAPPPQKAAPPPPQKNIDKDVQAYVEKLVDFLEKTFTRPEFIFDRYIYHLGRDEKSNDKIKKATNAYANLKEDELPLVCCDITAFGGAEDGLLLTNKGIFVHNVFDNVRYFPYGTISSIELRGFIVKDIYINGFKVESPAGFGNDEKQKFANLLIYFRNTLM